VTRDVDRQQLNVLFTRLADGDRTALAPVAEQLHPVLHAFCVKVLGATGDAEDATQEALIKVFAQVQNYDREHDALSWCFAIAFWECRTFLRRRERQGLREQSLVEESRPSAGNLEEHLIARSDFQALRKVIEKLSPQHVETLIRCFSEEQLDAAVIEQKISAAAQRKRKERALAQLRHWWKMFHGDA
jgi:RNA polymerase sigma-70 factor (ECF subfamily)